MFKVFKRSCRNWDEFAKAKRYTIDRVKTAEEALKMCNWFNERLSVGQIRRGTKYEFIKE